jgi:hypothetical protein
MELIEYLLYVLLAVWIFILHRKIIALEHEARSRRVQEEAAVRKLKKLS